MGNLDVCRQESEIDVVIPGGVVPSAELMSACEETVMEDVNVSEKLETIVDIPVFVSDAKLVSDFEEDKGGYVCMRGA